MSQKTDVPARERAGGLDPLVLSVDESRKYLGGIGRSSFYKIARDGEIELVKIAGRRMSMVASLKAYVERARAGKAGHHA